MFPGSSKPQSPTRRNTVLHKLLFCASLGAACNHTTTQGLLNADFLGPSAKYFSITSDSNVYSNLTFKATIIAT